MVQLGARRALGEPREVRPVVAAAPGGAGDDTDHLPRWPRRLECAGAERRVVLPVATQARHRHPACGVSGHAPRGLDVGVFARLPASCARVVRQVPEVERDEGIAEALEALRDNLPLRTELICRGYLERNPGSVDHLRLLGNALGRQGRYAEAEQVVRQAVSLKPDYPHLHEDLGSVLALQERYTEAVPCFEQAIRLEPDEGHFYALKGDALLVQKKNAAASDAYTAAIQRNDSFFYYYLQRGLVAERQHDDESARGDLETSLKMLPTGPAYYSLGNIALRARQYDAARQYFASAAGAEGPVGEAATLSLMKLELSGSPEKYLRKEGALDAGGKLVVAIANATKVPVTGLVVSVQYLDAGGKTREFRRELSGTLAGGQQLQVATGLGPFQNSNQFRIAIVGARVAE
ncbi:MAG: tetratricopeptide repeat protein [Gammaproteobacteria bacterium]|nr:tetratricopeptide repeat protein [Gammaproteobacteria bacterium]